MAGKFVGQRADSGGRDAASFAALHDGLRHDRVLEQQPRGLHGQWLVAERKTGLRIERRRPGGLARQRRLAVGTEDQVGVAVLVALCFSDRQTDVGAAQEAALARVAGFDDDEPGRAGKRRFAQLLGHGEIRVGQIGPVDASVVEHPAHHAQRQRAVGAGADRNPAPALGGGAVVGIGQHRVDHNVVKLALAAPLGQQAGAALERVAGMARRCADEDHEFTVGQIGLGVRHLLHVAKQRAGARAEGAAAVGAVPDKIERSVRLVPEAPGQRFAAVIDA